MAQIENDLLQLQDVWMDAVRRKDHETLDRILADEFTLISARLGFIERAQWLSVVGQYDIEDFEYEHSDIHVYGQVAVVNSRYSQKATFGDQDLSSIFLVTDVWVNRDDRWQVVTRHSSVPTESQAWALGPESRGS